MIVADTGGLLALLDKPADNHAAVHKFFADSTSPWIVPWAVLPELDYMARKFIGTQPAGKFLNDVKNGVFVVDSNIEADLPRAIELLTKKPSLGLVDAVVMAQAERYHATAVVTVDERDFNPWRMTLNRHLKLVPLDK
jgi:uncharacterized protein